MIIDTVELGSRARISGHAIRDHLLNPVCGEPDEVPWRAEAITPAWLTPRLCHGTAGAEVTHIAVEDASAGSSVRKRLRVSYNEAGHRAGLPSRLFAKTTPTVRTRLTSGPSAAQESRFFVQLSPLLPIEVPRHHHSALDRATGRSIHLFDDLSATRGARFCDFRTRFSRTEMEAALDLLACLHGRFHGCPELATRYAWIPTYETFFAALARTGTRHYHEKALQEARALIPGEVFEAREALWPSAEAALRVHADNSRSVIHSDVHPGNWYLTAEGAPGLCDWQCIAQGHWSRDLAYALSSMLEIPARRAWEQELIAYYLRALARRGGPAVSFEVAWRDYQCQLPAALLMWTPTLCHPPTMPDMQPPEVSLEMIGRITTAIGDLGASQCAR